MDTRLVSVIIPAYNQAEFIGDAIQSVLDQTYQNFEIIVVNDASTDNTDEVVGRFKDNRLKYITHKENARLSATRNTAIRASQGGVLALLDADDIYHPEKLHAHVNFLTEHPEIGVSYNSRYTLHYSSKEIAGIWRPSMRVGLVDLLLGFPFSPSDMVVRRDWAFKIGLFDPKMGTAEDTDFPCRLALAGCQFAGIDRALNYRRYHSGRPRKNLQGRVDDVRRAQAAIYSDPRCPTEARDLGALAIKLHLKAVMSLAYLQEETHLAQKFTRELVELDPQVMMGEPCEFVNFITLECIADENLDHEEMLDRVARQLPAEFATIHPQLEIAKATGALLRGLRAATWNGVELSRVHLARAKELKAVVHPQLILFLVPLLLSYENEFGFDKTIYLLERVTASFAIIEQGQSARSLREQYLVMRAFESYFAGKFERVPKKVMRVVTEFPRHVMNRGMLSIFVRSIAKSLQANKTAPSPSQGSRVQALP
ncbi:MAG: glycosyltransferase [Anaerolineales bacterium]|nr:glycosyltransferase [Anaerolineales bacterium]